jgi:hypothetical protein
MHDPGDLEPELDGRPASKPCGKADKTKGVGPQDLDVRLDLLPTESQFRVAGTAGMILGCSIFVLFAVPVSAMLTESGEPGGLLEDEGWLYRRWIARMATVLILSLVAVLVSWGLSRCRPWSRWASLGLGAVVPVVLLASFGFRHWAGEAARRELILTHPCVGIFIYPASLAIIASVCSSRGRTVLSPDYEGLVARTPKLRADWREGLWPGLGLALCMMILFWTAMWMILVSLVAAEVIRTI